MSDTPQKEEVIQAIVRDSADLLQKTAALRDELDSIQQKNASLETELEETRKKVAEAKIESENLKTALLEKLEPFADRLVQHGSLSPEKKVAFIEIIRDDPSQFVDVVEKLSSSSHVDEMGHPSGKKSASVEKDPIGEFANS